MRNRSGIWASLAVALSLCLALVPAAALADENTASTAQTSAVAQTAQVAETAAASQSAQTAQAATTEQTAQTVEPSTPATVAEPATASEPAAVSEPDQAVEPSAPATASEPEETLTEQSDDSEPTGDPLVDVNEPIDVVDGTLLAGGLESSDEPGVLGEAQGMTLPDVIAHNDLSAQATNASVKVESGLYYDQAFEVLRLVNIERTSRGLTALKMDKVLLSVAMLRAVETSVHFSHTRPDGTSCFTTFPTGLSRMGENIAANYRSAASVVNGWMNSEGHRANILNPDYNIMGVGCIMQAAYGIPYWTQCFGRGTVTPVTQPVVNPWAVFTFPVSTGTVSASRFFTCYAPNSSPYAFTTDVGAKEDIGQSNYVAAFFTNTSFPGYPVRISGQCLTITPSNTSTLKVVNSGTSIPSVKNVSNGKVTLNVKVGSVYSASKTLGVHAPVTRLGGNTALDTMSLIVDKGWAANSGGTVVLATNDGYWDALSASGIAGLAGKASVLLTNGKSLSAQTKAKIARIKPSKIIVCGGKAAISDGVKSAAASAAGISASKAIRVSGATATATAAAIARQAASITAAKWSDTAFITTNDGYWDALSVSPASYALKMPIFLTEGKGSVSSTTIAAMKAAGIKKFYIVGGTAAVSDSVKKQLTNASFSFVQRLSGATAVKTSTVVANWEMSHGMQPNGMAIATNDGYWDALTGAALCGKAKTPLLLVSDYDRSSLDFASKYKSKVKQAYVFGGTAAVSTGSYQALVSKLV